MAQKLPDGTYACTICGTHYSQASKADNCRDSHDLLYIPISKDELNKLLHALMFDELDLVPQSLIETLRKYARLQVTK